MEKYTLKEHLLEIKKRFFFTFGVFVLIFCACYELREEIYEFLLNPLLEASKQRDRRLIYTGLAEAFFSYIKLSAFCAFCLVLPVICYQLYMFISPGLLKHEKRLVKMLLFFSPFLFYIGGGFVFCFVMPRAWEFFLSYENYAVDMPLILEARISEYLDLVMQFVLAFGLAFQLPVIIVILGVLGLVNSGFLRQKRRGAIITIFVIAAIFTPPDVISQIALAIPLLLLYEVSIMLCKLVEKKES